jgi:hypothetical protein
MKAFAEMKASALICGNCNNYEIGKDAKIRFLVKGKWIIDFSVGFGCYLQVKGFSLKFIMLLSDI